MTPTVIIWRERLLPWSETFIAAQAKTLVRHRPLLTGLTNCRDGLNLKEYAQIPRLLLGNRISSSLYRLHQRFPWTWRNKLLPHRPILVHAHFGRDATTAAPLAAALGIPLIATFHGYDATRAPPSWDRPLPACKHRLIANRLKKMLKSSLTCVAVSGFIRDRLISIGARPDRIHVCPIGIDLGSFVNPQPHDLSRRGRRVLFIGRLVEVKGCRHLIDAAARLAAAGVTPEIIIAGDGPLRGALEARAKTSGARISFLGAVTPDRIRVELASARVLCVPSVTDTDGAAEGFGMVFLEASAMGTPVVSSRSGGIPEAVADGETGFLVDERDDQALAVHLARLLDDDDIWLKMSGAGLRRVRTNFDIRACTDRLEDLYTNVVQSYRRIEAC